MTSKRRTKNKMRYWIGKDQSTIVQIHNYVKMLHGEFINSLAVKQEILAPVLQMKT